MKYFVFVFTIITSVVACVPEDEAVDLSNQCIEDFDCPEGFLCIAELNVCKEKEIFCNTTEDCSSFGEVCEYNECISYCEEDKDCLPGHICTRNGFCEEIGLPCKTAMDCPEYEQGCDKAISYQDKDYGICASHETWGRSLICDGFHTCPPNHRCSPFSRDGMSFYACVYVGGCEGLGDNCGAHKRCLTRGDCGSENTAGCFEGCDADAKLCFNPKERDIYCESDSNCPFGWTCDTENGFPSICRECLEGEDCTEKISCSNL